MSSICNGWVRPFWMMVGFCFLAVPIGVGRAADLPVTDLPAASLSALSLSDAAAGEQQRPKVGLVLAGGGARGGAHIGVLKALEEHKVPIDFITGTSFGAIVGSFYAAGYTADELEVALALMDWENLLSDNAPRSGRSYQRKLDDEETALDFEFSVGENGLALPQGLVRGNQLRLMLRRYLSRVAHVQDFDDLPIPFRAVATDLETGGEVVMRSGDIASAVLASMAVPGLFPPVDREGHILVDGGLVNNMPVTVVKEMGADIVILVDIGTPLAERDEITSFPKVFGQLLSLLTLKNRQAQLDEMTDRDILLKPDLKDIKLTDFHLATSAIPEGYASAQEVGDALNLLALPDAEWQAHKAARQVEFEPPTIDFITVDNSSSLPDKYIRSLIRHDKNQPLNEAQLSDDLTRIYGTGYFDRVEYRILERGAETGIHIEAKERSVGKKFVRFGLSLSDDFSGNNHYNIAASYTVLGLNSLGAEWRLRAQVGDILAVNTEFYQPLNVTQDYFAITSFRAGSVVRGITNDRGVTVADARITDGDLKLGVGRNISNIGRFTVGLQRGIARAKLHTPDFEFPAFSIHSASLYAKFETDTFDNADFPHRGSGLIIEYSDGRTFLGGESTVNTLEASYSRTQTWGRNTLTGFINSGMAYGGDETETDEFSLGGFLNLSGLRQNQISGKYYGVAGFAYYRRLNHGGVASLFGVPIYAGLSLEAGNTWNRSSDIEFSKLRYGGSIFLGADTPIGPLYLGSGYTAGQADAQVSAFMYLGRPF